MLAIPSLTVHGYAWSGRPRCTSVHSAPVRRYSSRATNLMVKCDPGYNPQNVNDPKVMPSPSFTPEEAVRVQLDALKSNDEPWTNHGIQTAYEFSEDAGSMERSMYFGFSKDLYHFDHFLGMFNTRLGHLVNNTEYSILEGPGADAPEPARVVTRVTGPQGGDAFFEFTLVRRALGRKKGAWMTKSLVKREGGAA